MKCIGIELSGSAVQRKGYVTKRNARAMKRKELLRKSADRSGIGNVLLGIALKREA